MNNMKTFNYAGKLKVSIWGFIIILVTAVSVSQLFGQWQPKKSLEGAFYWKNGKAMFFKGNRYIRYDINTDRTDAGYPKTIDNNNWPGLPWKNGIDTAVNWDNGKIYFFKGNQYIRYDINADRADGGYPKAIDNNNWPGLPWKHGIDAAVNWGNGKAYFFKGNQYVRYDINADRVDAGYPKAINNETWPGLPWREIDAAVNWGNGKAYFFKGSQYIRYDINADRVDPGYPKIINNETWPGLPALFR
ncbi:MAG TPA: hemopexin repeat-containing protein [Candidatus Deferrimicrobium sp.]|nr:hemopexin repeat-containing protein [Candidatus Kapabacteria bacterium]HLP58918.1 hemopexin repeat-containing protein [Candidatus Deferrimicrobium sp.]